MKLCFVTILEPVNLSEIFDDALIWESTQKKTDNINIYHELRLVSQQLQVRNFSKLIQNFVGTTLNSSELFQQRRLERIRFI